MWRKVSVRAKFNFIELTPVFDCPMKMAEPRPGSESDDPDSPEYTFRVIILRIILHL